MHHVRLFPSVPLVLAGITVKELSSEKTHIVLGHIREEVIHIFKVLPVTVYDVLVVAWNTISQFRMPGNVVLAIFSGHVELRCLSN